MPGVRHRIEHMAWHHTHSTSAKGEGPMSSATQRYCSVNFGVCSRGSGRETTLWCGNCGRGAGSTSGGVRSSCGSGSGDSSFNTGSTNGCGRHCCVEHGFPCGYAFGPAQEVVVPFTTLAFGVVKGAARCS